MDLVCDSQQARAHTDIALEQVKCLAGRAAVHGRIAQDAMRVHNQSLAHEQAQSGLS